MAQNVAALTGTPANMAAIETEFQANWKDLDFMKAGRRKNAFVTLNLAAGQTAQLLIRSASGNASGVPVWAPSAAGVWTSPSNFTTAGDEYRQARFVIGEEWSGLVLWASAACNVQIATTDT